MSDAPAVIVLIPAYQEAERIAATVAAARALPGVTRVLVVDDGSTDGTAELAERAGAEVLRMPRNGGKGAAMRAGLAACPGDDDDIFLLLDADLGETAAQADRLLEPVLAGEADLSIARFPRAGKAGFGLVKGLARMGTWLLTRRVLQAPISGQRACRRWVLEAAPLADGYGIEVAMNIAAGDAGARIVEVPVEMTHAATGRDFAGFKHRGRQFAHIFAALAAAGFGRTGERLIQPVRWWRLLIWLLAITLVGYFSLVIHRAIHQYDAHPAAYFIGFLLAALLGPLLTAKCSGLVGARRKNYRGRYLPALGGLLVLPVSLYLLAEALLFQDRSSAVFQRVILPLPIFLLGWMLLGLLDDILGTAQRKGFRGHLGALLHGQFTSGGIKLLGGGILALAMAFSIFPFTPFFGILTSAVLIALMANAFNLFDLRPGRALKVYWLLSAVIVLLVAADLNLTFFSGVWGDDIFAVIGMWSLAIPLLLLATLLYAPFDFAGMMMLGDTGANPLGAFLGLCLALLLPVWGQGIAILLLVGLHVYAERASITKLIARVPVLHWLDRLGRSDMAGADLTCGDRNAAEGVPYRGVQ